MSGIGEQNVLDFMDFLLTEYAFQISQQNNVSYEQAEAVLKASAPLMDFRKFVYAYLSTNRPAGISHTEANYLIQLTNTKRFALAPSAAHVPGTMQSSVAVAVTGREALAEMQANSQGMRGGMSTIGEQQNRMASQPAFNYDQPGFFRRLGQ